jgi:uncharacterized phage protein gp47/JayE
VADVGLLPEGFVPDTFDNMVEEIEVELRGEWGPSIPLGDGTFIGHVIRILCERLQLLWEVGEISFSSLDVDANNGAPQRAIAAMTGTFETPAASSTVTETMCGDDGTSIAEGNVVSTSSTGKRFATSADVTLEQLDDWQPDTVYDEGDRVTNADRCYVCITAGTSDSSGGPTTTDDDITDNDAHWRYLGEGQAAADVVMASEETGEIVAVAGDLTSIETPVAGWNTARNLLDAELGRLAMTDEELRVLREAEVAQPGTGIPDAIRAALLFLTGVTNATVFYNNTDETDEDGLPPHSVECLVQGGDDQDIWDCLWVNVPIGIRTIGTEEGIALDAEGAEQPVNFSRPEEIDIYVIVDLIEYPITYGGDDAVKAAIAAWGDAQKTGKNVVASGISAQAFSVAGVLDVTSVKIDDAPVPTVSTTIPISKRQLAVYDTSRIEVNATEGEP